MATTMFTRHIDHYLAHGAVELAREIVRAELRDNWFLADLLRPQLRQANVRRRLLGMRPIRATQHWYFEQEPVVGS